MKLLPKVSIKFEIALLPRPRPHWPSDFPSVAWWDISARYAFLACADSLSLENCSNWSLLYIDSPKCKALNDSSLTLTPPTGTCSGSGQISKVGFAQNHWPAILYRGGGNIVTNLVGSIGL